ncbi:MAG: hypothetical protein HS109_12430 [Burkholderiales bacterium]|nr:hypothetical protein [Burkholderiales bacterium]
MKLVQEALARTPGQPSPDLSIPIHGVNEIHPRPVEPPSWNNRAFLEARSTNARMALRRLDPELTPVSAEATAR